MADDRDELVEFDESSEIEWRQWFVDFRARVWPMFEEQGFTFVEAVMMWRQEMIVARLQMLLDLQN